MGDRTDDVERHVKAGRTPIEGARETDPAAPEGAEPAVPSYTDTTGVSDLGVDEPTPSVPGPADDSSATGMFSGETEADRRKEDAVRGRLEKEFPNTRGDWKRSGAVPGRDPVEPDR